MTLNRKPKRSFIRLKSKAHHKNTVIGTLKSGKAAMRGQIRKKNQITTVT